MTLLSGAALAALVLALPLIALHLRRRKPPRRAVGSLLAWRDLPAVGGGGARKVGRPPLPLLLALQLLALALLVFALAHPASEKSAAGTSHVYVVDESMWMGAEEGGAPRIDAARTDLRERLGELPGDEAVRIVGAGATPSVLFEGEAAAAGGALAKLEAGRGGADLAAALRLAVRPAGRRRQPGDASAGAGGTGADGEGRRLLLRRTGDRQTARRRRPRRRRRPLRPARRGSVRSLRPGHQPRRARRAKCRCGSRPPGKRRAREKVEVPAGGSAPLIFPTPPGGAVEVSLVGADGLAADDSAFVSVPEPGGERITLVGNRTRALPLARALASVPGRAAAAADPQHLQGDRSGDQRPARPRRLHAQGRAARRARPVPRQSAELPRRQGDREDARQPHERLRSGEPAARRGRPLLADDRVGRLQTARPAGFAERRGVERRRPADRRRHRRGQPRRDPLLRALRIEPAAAGGLPGADRQHRRLVAAARPAERRRRDAVRARRAARHDGRQADLGRRWRRRRPRRSTRAPKSRSASSGPGNYAIELSGPWGTRRLALRGQPRRGAPPAPPRSTSPRRRRPKTPATPTGGSGC